MRVIPLLEEFESMYSRVVTRPFQRSCPPRRLAETVQIKANALAASDIILVLDKPLEWNDTARGEYSWQHVRRNPAEEKNMETGHICAKVIDARVEPSGIARGCTTYQV